MSDESVIPYVTSADLSGKLTAEKGLVLVEFCVPAGCFRCDRMRPQVDELADSRSEQTDVYRVNLTSERAFAQQVGIDMCPTYIAYVDGREVFRTAFPTSGDMIASELDRAWPPIAVVEEAPEQQPDSLQHSEH